MNAYIQLTLNGLSTGFGVLFATWIYDRFIRNRLDKTHIKIKKLVKRKRGLKHEKRN